MGRYSFFRRSGIRSVNYILITFRPVFFKVSLFLEDKNFSPFLQLKEKHWKNFLTPLVGPVAVVEKSAAAVHNSLGVAADILDSPQAGVDNPPVGADNPQIGADTHRRPTPAQGAAVDSKDFVEAAARSRRLDKAAVVQSFLCFFLNLGIFSFEKYLRLKYKKHNKNFISLRKRASA